MSTAEIIRKNARSLVRQFGFFRSYYEETNATHGETHALIELSRCGSLEVGELARMLNVDKAGASKILLNMRKKGWSRLVKAPDARKKVYELTAEGKKITRWLENHANQRMSRAFKELSTSEQKTVQDGMELLAHALKVSRARSEYHIRICEPEDDRYIASIVKRSLKDMGFDGPGTAAADPSVNYLSSFNRGRRRCYLVAEKDGRIMGGAGIMPLAGESDDVCELVRMFLHPEARSSGLSYLLMDEALTRAKQYKYKVCYLETTEKMKAAQKLYLKYGFDYVCRPRGNTGHYACDVRMEKEL